jgi:hypothetical protein
MKAQLEAIGVIEAIKERGRPYSRPLQVLAVLVDFAVVCVDHVVVRLLLTARLR